ncbi:MAG: DUF6184 family natural product biosynthesis lipoprotein [Polyangiales bacterium]
MTKPIFAMVALTALSFGCESRENETTYVTPAPTPITPKKEAPPPIEPIGGGPAASNENTAPMNISIESAADRMAEAHCQSAMNCKEVGKGKKAGDWSTCMDNNRKTSTKGLSYASCPKGVDGSKLMGCLDSIHSGVCTDIMSSVSTLRSCSTAALCAK